jgi:hypothetical protein
MILAGIMSSLPNRKNTALYYRTGSQIKELIE